MVHLSKPAFRVLGIAECFDKRKRKSILAALSYRRDGYVDGVYLTWVTVGGLDATEKIVSLVKSTERKDFNVLMLNGCIISWFNVVDLEALYKETGTPVICLSYEESGGLEEYIREYFPGDEVRLEMYRRLGKRELVYVKSTGSYVYARYVGISKAEVRELLSLVTKHGKVPEPLRLAQAVARAVYTFLETSDPAFLES